MSTPCIVAENPGEIDIRGATISGVTVKETTNPIGYFGTGLKYAIGILLREGQLVYIQSGTKVHNFAIKEIDFRGEPFNIITMDGHELGYTDQLGKNWKLWMAYRELDANALDEGGTVTRHSRVPPPTKDKTRVIVVGQAFQETHKQRAGFILQSSPLEETTNLNIHSGRSEYVFYHGFRVGELPQNNKRPSIYTYNILEGLSLTEDRTFSYGFQVISRISEGLLRSNDPEIVQKILTAQDHYFESNLDFEDNVGFASETFMEVLRKLVKSRHFKVNLSAKKMLEKVDGVKHTPEAIALTAVQKIQLERAVKFCGKIAFPIEDYPILVTDSLGTNILGAAKDDTIYLAKECFTMGTLMIASTLIEEFCHLRYGYMDETRTFQNFLLNKIVEMGQEILGEAL